MNTGWNGFNNLDLSDVVPDDYAPLTTGEYELEVVDIEMKTGANGQDKRLVLTMNDTEGSGSIRVGFNLFHRGSPEAMRIGRQQFKSFLTYSGHPNPDHPGDVNTLRHLRVRAFVAPGKPYRGDDGRERTSMEVKRFIPKGASTGGSGQRSDNGPMPDDRIPF